MVKYVVASCKIIPMELSQVQFSLGQSNVGKTRKKNNPLGNKYLFTMIWRMVYYSFTRIHEIPFLLAKLHTLTCNVGPPSYKLVYNPI